MLAISRIVKILNAVDEATLSFGITHELSSDSPSLIPGQTYRDFSIGSM